MEKTKIKISDVLKRLLSFTLAVLMTVALVPEITLQVEAATAVTLPVSNLGASFTKTGNGSPTVSWSPTTDGIKGSLVGGHDGSGFKHFYYEATTTLTLTNNFSSSALLSFDYDMTVVDSAESVTVNTTKHTANASNQSFSVLLEPKGSISIVLSVNQHVQGWWSDPNKNGATITISNLKLVEKKIVETTFEPSDSTMGSYSVVMDVNGTATTTSITSTTKHQQDAQIAYTLNATANDGYTFLGWYDVTNGTYLSFTNGASWANETPITVTAKFAPLYTTEDEQHPYKVGSYYFADLNDANAFAKNNGGLIILAKDATLPAGNYEISSGNTLLIPYDDANTQVGAKPNHAEELIIPTIYKKLVLAPNAHVTVNGAVEVGALISRKQEWNASPTGPVGTIQLDKGSSITVESGGFLYAWGYITGIVDYNQQALSEKTSGTLLRNGSEKREGEIVVKSGGTVYECFQTRDWRGGMAALNYLHTDTSTANDNPKDRVFIMSQYYVQNITVPMTLHAGAIEKGFFAISITLVSPQTVEIPFVGVESSSSSALFIINSGYVVKDYDEDRDRLVIDSYADLKMGFISMTMQLSVLGSRTVNSSDYDLPLNNNLTLNIHSGSKVNISETMVMLPGTEINVASGAECVLGGGKNLFIYDSTTWKDEVTQAGKTYISSPYGFCGANEALLLPVSFAPGQNKIRTEADLVDASIKIEGTVDISNGHVYTTYKDDAVNQGANIFGTKTGNGKIIIGNKGTQEYHYQLQQGGSDNKEPVAIPIPIQPALLQNADGSYLTTNQYAGTYKYSTEYGRWYLAADENKNDIYVTVTFDCNGGSAIDPITVKVGEPIIVPDDPTREGYTFEGWNLLEGTQGIYTIPYSKDDGAKTSFAAGDKFALFSDGTINNAPSELKLTAQWTPEKYTITFMDGNDVYTTITDDFDKDLVLPQPVKTGYDFNGWYKDASLVTPSDLSKMPLGGTTLYAKWTAKTYTVVFNANGGTGSMADQSFSYDEEKALTANGFERTGYTFMGWSTVKDGEVVYNNNASVKNLAESGTVNLYAKWEAIKNTIVYNGVTTNELPANAVTKYGISDTFELPEPTERIGYTFGGWYYDDKFESEADVDSLKDKFNGTEAQTINLYAQWTPITYTVKFNANGGTGTMANQTFNYDEEKVLTSNAFTRTGYTFTGWNTMADGSGASYGNGVEVSNLTAVDGETVDLYAQWDVHGNKVTWVYGNGTQDKVDENVAYGTEIQKPADPEKKGHTFAGWYVGENEVEWPYTMPDESVTFTAQWTVIKYNITYSGVEDATNNNPATYDITTETFTLNNPTKEGYTFAGWTGTGLDSATMTVTIKNGSTGDRSYTATWSAKPVTIKFVDGEKTIEEVNLPFGTAIGDIFPEITGYHSVIWGVDNKQIGAEYIINNAEGVTVTVLNKKANTYTVVFNANDGSETPATVDQSMTYDKSANLTANAFTRTGYTFNGWNSEADGKGAPYGNGVKVSNLTAENNGTFTLYAQWTLNSHKVTWSYGYEGMADEETTVNFGATPSHEAPTRDGYNFLGWYDEANDKLDANYKMPDSDVKFTAKWEAHTNNVTWVYGNGTQDKVDENVAYGTEIQKPADPEKKGHTFAGWYVGENEVEWPYTMPDSSVTFTAKWTVNTYKVTFDVDGVKKEKNFEYGATVTAIADPEKEGYTFAGWSPTLPATMPAENLEVKATWDVNTYKVTFDVDGKTTEQSYAYGATVTAPEAPTKEGYTFAGWDAEIPSTMPAKNLTIKATWTVNEYNLTWVYDNGTTSTTTKVAYGTTITAPEKEPTKTGHTFAGWSPALPTTMPAKDLTITAQWTINQYTVSFFDGDETEYKKITQDYNTKIEAPEEPTKTGYTFGGWLREQDQIVEFPFTLTKDVSLKAKWNINQYTINFDTDGGSKVDAITADYGATVTAPEAPTKTGYIFKGWADADGNSTEVPTTMPLDGATLTAVWNANTYTVKFNGNGATKGTMGGQEFTYDKSQSLTANAFTRTGYTFGGWNTEANGNGTPYADKASVTNLATSGEVIFYAQWTPNNYTIRFDKNNANATGELTAISATYDVSVGLPQNAFALTGYTFTGWNTKANGTGTAYADKASVKNLATSGEVTLYAQWKANTYTITFETNGGSSVESITADYGATVTAPTTEPTKEGYTFAGWYSDAELTTAYTFTTMPLDGAKLYAKWNANTYTVKFNANNGTGTMDDQTFTYDVAGTLTANAFTRTGYTFNGWNTQADGNGTTYTNEQAVSNLTSVNGETVHLYAQWSVNSYTVTFDVDGKETEVSYAYGATVTAPTTEPTKEGYTFIGWYNGNDKFDFSTTMPANDLTLTAQWSVNSYTVTFDFDSGTLKEGQPTDNPMTFTYGGTIVPPEVEKEGYRFVRWAIVENGTDTFDTLPETMPAKNLEVKAIWTARFHYSFTVDGTLYDSGELDDGDAIPMPETNPEKAGYTFNGWTTNSTVDHDSVTGNYKINGANVVFNALWTPISYTITYDTNGGALPEGTADTVTYNIESEKIALPTPTRANYDFGGWYDNENFTGEAVTEVAKGSMGNITFYAKWNAKQYVVRFDGVETPAGLDEKITAPADPTKTGYTFAGWKHNDTVFTFTDTTTANDSLVTSTDGANYIDFVSSWTANKYTINFDLNGGVVDGAYASDGIDPINATYDEKVTLPSGDDITPPNGYEFEGWSTVKNGRTVYKGGAKIENLATENGAVVTLYAYWKPISYTINYVNADGVTNSNVTSYTIEDTVTLKALTKLGYDFDGWYENAEFTGTPVTEFSAKTGNKTFYAKWTAKNYGITYQLNGGTNNEDNPATYTIEDTVTLKAPTQVGYKFTGWTDSKNEPITQISKGTTDVVVLYANWEIVTYNVSFVLNDGDWVGEEPTLTFDVEDLSNISLPENAEREHYNFGGWYLDENLKTEANATTIKSALASLDGTTITLYAKWNIHGNTVTWVYGNGADDTTVTVEYGSKITAPENPTRDGYTFEGWFDGNGTKWTADYIMPDESVTFTAQWNTVPYSITYDLGDGSVDGTNPTSYTIESADFTLINPTKAGYVFAGWTGTDLAEATTSVTITTGSMGNREYTATWTPENYTITYDLASGNVDGTNPAGYTIESADFTLVNPTRDGYEFAGWTGTDLNSATETVTIANGSTGNRSYTATWTAIEYEITYDLDGGSDDGNPATYTIENGFTLTEPTKTGYVFVGWMGTDLTEATKEVTVAKGSTGKREYTATWTPETYTITYDYAGGTATGNPAGYTIESEDITLINPTRDGYEFAGWKDADGKVETTVTIASGSTGSRSYTATWTAINYTITYSGVEGATNNNPATYTIENGFTLTEPTKTGYFFAGWTGTDLDEATKAVTVAKGSTGKREYTATWTPKTYTITYDYAGGNAVGNLTSYTIESADFTLINPTRDGYTFAGWKLNEEETANINVTIAKGSTGDRNYTATWTAKEYEITFESNGGSDVTAIKAKYGEKVSAPTAPEKNGYTFKGWFSDAELTTAYTFTTMPLNGATLYAKWEAVTYTINFTVGTGATYVQPMNYTVETETFTLPTSSKNGYTFAGWYENEDYSGNALTEITKGTTGNMNLHAKWTANEYTITFNSNGGSAVEAIKAKYGDAISAPADPTMKGYTFGGWYEDEALTKKYTVPANMTIGDKTVYAKWTANTYEVIFDANGGTGTMTNQTFTYDSAETALKANTLKRTGYTFAGWNTKADGTGTAYADKATVKNLAESGTFTLYAQWTLDVYTITYNLDGGSLAEGATNPASYSVTSEDIKLINPTKEGYTFAGWTGTDITTATKEVTITKGSIGNRVYTANWTINSHKVIWSYGYEGKADEETTVNFGATPSHTTPSRTGYNFLGWYDESNVKLDTDYKMPDSDVKFTAKWEIKTFTVKWTDYDGTLLETDEKVPYGTIPTFDGKTPERESSETQNFTFSGWTPEVNTVTADVTYKATYTASDRLYTVKFVVNGAETEEQYKYNAYLQFEGDMTKPSTEKYDYKFAGWTTEKDGTEVKYSNGTLPNVTEDATYYAVFTETIRKFTVKWDTDGNGSVDSTDVFDYGTKLTKVGSKTDTVDYTYEFAGWSLTPNGEVLEPLPELTEDVTYYAVFAQHLRQYTITWYYKSELNEETGEYTWASAEETYDYYAEPKFPEAIYGAPTKDKNEKYSYLFKEAWCGKEDGITNDIKPVTGNTSYYAVFDPVAVKYELTYDLNGGTIEEGSRLEFDVGYGSGIVGRLDHPNKVIDGTTYIRIPEKVGYEFVGWTYNGERVGTYDEAAGKVTFVESFTMPTHAVTFVAEWKVAQFTITFSVDGVETKYTLDYGTPLSGYVVTPEKEGHDFKYWVDENEKQVTIPETMPAEDVYRKAYFDTKSYAIGWDTNGDGIADLTNYADHGTIPAYAGKTPTKASTAQYDYTFIGWSPELTVATSDTVYIAQFSATLREYAINWIVDGVVTPINVKYGEIPVYPNGTPEKTADSKYTYEFTGWDKEIVPVTGIATYIAGFKAVPVPYTVFIDTNGGSTLENVTAGYGEPISIAEPTMLGHTFAGWVDAESGTPVTVPATMPVGGLNIKATWSVNTYTITFNTGGGTNVDPISKEFGSQITPPSDPVKEGYTFGGWDIKVPETMPAENVTITAKWNINQYTIAFNTDGGNEIAVIKQDFGTAVTAPSDPIKEGYTFMGWVDENGAPATVPETMPAHGVSLKATWKATEYVITYDLDGGLAETKNVYTFEETFTLPTPEKIGYTFIGWTGTDIEGYAMTLTVPMGTVGDRAYKANWKINQYTLTFDTDGGTAIDPIIQDYGTSITVPAAPEKVGHTFIGWDPSVPATMPAENRTLTAQWAPNRYIITFNTDGGTSIDSIEGIYGEAVTAPDDPTKTGHTFLYWVDENGNEAAIPNTIPADNVTLTAVWEANEYTITFVNTGDTVIEPITQKYGTIITAPSIPTKEGSYFRSWSPAIPKTMPAYNMTVRAEWTPATYYVYYVVDGVDYEVQTYFFGDTIYAPIDPEDKEGYVFAGWTPLDPEFSVLPETMPSRPITVVAEWSKLYTVTFTNGDGKLISREEYSEGDTIKIPAEPTREGYTFAGWDTVVPETMPKKNLEIKATWTANEYTITFAGTGDTVIPAITASYGTVIEAIENPTKTGYKFMGWDTAIPSTMPAYDMTVTALWQINQHTVTFKEADGTVIKSETLDYGAPVTAPEVSPKAGYVFSWDAQIPETMPDKDIEFVAKWTPEVYNITYVVNGGTLPEDARTTYTVEDSFTLVKPERLGYTFIGWSAEDIEGTLENVTLVQGSVGNREYTANWTINTYTVTFDSDGGTAVEAVSKNYGDALTAPAEPVKTGHTFDGWYLNGEKVDFETFTMPAENVALKAQWTVNVHKIYFDVNGGHITIDPVERKFGEALSIDDIIPEREGHKFIGWKEEILSTMPDNDLTFTAEWEICKYQITFITNGGSVIEPIELTYGEPIDVSNIIPVLEDHVFEGWNETVPNYMPAGGLTLTAKWKYNRTGWTVEEGGTTYLVNGEKVYFDRWQTIGDKQYYFDSSSYILKGALKTAPTKDGTRFGLYIFDENDGHLRTDISGLWNNEDDTYLTEAGEVLEYPGLVRIGDDYYYFGEDGKAVKDGTYEVIKTNGLMDAGEYEFDADGKMIIKVLRGDLDDDGDVDNADAIYCLYTIIFGEEAYPRNQNCDFDGDSLENNADAIYLLYYVIFGDLYPLH